MDSSTFTHPRLGTVTLVPHPRARRLTLTVKPSGEVRLTFPLQMKASQALAFLEERILWVEESRRRLEIRLRPTQAFSHAQVELLRQQARADLPSRVEQLARHFGFHYGRITIRASRTKWGCCTAQNNLSLSLFLMLLPEHLRNFVLLHELCHTVHHNHSPQFHALLDQCLGGCEKALRKELKSYTIR